MPFPCPTHKRLLEHDFVVIVVNLASQQLLQGINDAVAVDKSTVDVFAEGVGNPQLTPDTGKVPTLNYLFRHLLISFGDPDEQVHFLGIEQSFDHDKAISIKLLDLLFS